MEGNGPVEYGDPYRVRRASVTGSWSNSGCGNPRRVRKAFAEEGSPTQGVRA